MSFHPSLPGDHHLTALFKRFPKGIPALLQYHDDLLRNDDSELTIAERELIAAHVSGLNNCTYCFVAHRRYAEAFGIAEDVFGEMRIDADHPSLRPGMAAALDFATRLTRDPSATTQADYDALTTAGWGEDGIHDIISVTALYNFMNRMLEGSGMKANVALPDFTPEKARASRYSGLLKLIGVS